MKKEKERYYREVELEDFHVGFEFEYQLPSGKWQECTFGVDEILHPETDQYCDNLQKAAHLITRVPKLRVHDFFSLGVVAMVILSPEPDYHTRNFIETTPDFHYDIYFTEFSGTVTIVARSVATSQVQVVFSGVVKCKSELRKLLKRFRVSC